jgi:hypothetical protein
MKIFDNLFGAICDFPGEDYTNSAPRGRHGLEARHQHIRDFAGLPVTRKISNTTRVFSLRLSSPSHHFNVIR